MDKAVNTVPIEGNHMIMRGESLRNGLLHGMSYHSCDTRPFLSGSGPESVYVSPVFHTGEAFNDLVASWNTCTPEGTECEVYGRVHIRAYDGLPLPDGSRGDGWTDWISWGRWSPFIRRSCPRCVDSHPLPSDPDTIGWAYANSFDGAGDSSLNTRFGIEADSFQLKAVLRKESFAVEDPRIFLLSATWKNTAKGSWPQDCSYPEETVAEKPSVLLSNVPAISQMRRDPSYSHVICSATCAAMAMNGLGADLLPEDVALLNYDYGFGGNGNWSFTCAAIAAYGFESYVSYASFEGLRQELCKGNAVCLSVKYTNRPDDTSLPYLENAPCRTNGHLICAVGYAYKEAVGERVYYVLDPAARSDPETGPLEYRESQLDKAWYRRACYITHAIPGFSAGSSPRRCATAVLVKEGEYGLFRLEGECGFPAPRPGFTEDRFEPFGSHGTICWFDQNDDPTRDVGSAICTANHPFHYDGYRLCDDGSLRITDGDLLMRLDEGHDVRFAVIGNDGRMLLAGFRS